MARPRPFRFRGRRGRPPFSWGCLRCHSERAKRVEESRCGLVVWGPPYAAPPSGRNRQRPPRDSSSPTGHRNDILKATARACVVTIRGHSPRGRGPRSSVANRPFSWHSEVAGETYARTAPAFAGASCGTPGRLGVSGGRGIGNRGGNRGTQYRFPPEAVRGMSRACLEHLFTGEWGKHD